MMRCASATTNCCLRTQYQHDDAEALEPSNQVFHGLVLALEGAVPEHAARRTSNGREVESG